MPRIKVKIDGLRELDRALGKLPEATAKASLRKILKEAGEPLASTARQNAPVFEGHLEESTDAGTRLTRRQASLHRKEMKDNRDFSEVFVGTANPAGMQEEFGNSHQSAHPWLRPAWDAQKQNVLFIITHRLWVVIEQAAARIAKKTSKGS